MSTIGDRILLHLADGRRLPVDPGEVYMLTVEGGNTLVRGRHATPWEDVRQLSELVPLFEPHGFLQIHRGVAVNLRRVRDIVPAGDGSWQVRLDPPVNRVLPVSRRRLGELWDAFGD
jgi:DNA-binding LytR/AlgR family response regulator